MSSTPVTVVLPLKALGAAKGRLADTLSLRDRRELVGWMFDRVATACRQSPAVDRIVVVAGDQAAAELARAQDLAVRVLPTPGLNRAVLAADRWLGQAVSLVVAADLPLLSAADVDAVVDAADVNPCVVVAPTTDGGTGALLRQPGGVIPPAFGPDSAARHEQAAHSAGVVAHLVRRNGWCWDVDTAEGLRQVGARDPTLRAWLGVGDGG